MNSKGKHFVSQAHPDKDLFVVSTLLKRVIRDTTRFDSGHVFRLSTNDIFLLEAAQKDESCSLLNYKLKETLRR